MNAEKNLETMKEMGSKAMENLNRLAELNMETMKELTTKQMEDFKFVMDQTKRQMELATEVKDFKGLNDFIKAQATVAKETGDRLVDDAKNRMEMITGVREKYATFIKEEVDKLSDKFRDTMPKM